MALLIVPVIALVWADKTPKAAAAPAAVVAPAPAATTQVTTNASMKFLFETGSAAIGPEAAPLLQDFVAAAGKMPAGKVVISGFHDASGDPAKNAELAKQRAFAVRDALKAAGIAEDRLVLEKPQELVGGADPAQARRVDVALR